MLDFILIWKGMLKNNSYYVKLLSYNGKVLIRYIYLIYTKEFSLYFKTLCKYKELSFILYAFNNKKIASLMLCTILRSFPRYIL